MAVINSDLLKAIAKGFSKIFAEVLLISKIDCENIATIVKVNSISVSYAWLADSPKMREWIGDRVLRDIKAHKYEISKKRWESTIEVDRDDIEYDNLGIVKPRILAMATDAISHYDELVYPLLESNGVCYDGKPFFATDHPVGDVTFSNIGKDELNQANFLAARAEMQGLTSENGKPLRIRPNLLIVPPELEIKALEILMKERLASGEDNITKGMMEYYVCDYLTDPKAWYLMDTSKQIKPLILQKNKEITFVAMDKPDDENVFMRAKYRYGTEAEDNAGYGLWQLAYKSKPVA